MKTIGDLIDFLEKIPEENWCRRYFEIENDGVVRRCVAGHINHHISGKAVHFGITATDEPAHNFLHSLGVSRRILVDLNNYPKDGETSKSSVLKYLKVLA